MKVELREGKWVVVDGDVEVDTFDTYHEACMSVFLPAITAAGEGSILPETWTGPIARSRETGDGRNFTNTAWSWRDPDVSRLPLMWQTETDMGHFSALLAGYITNLRLEGGDVTADGAFFASDEGREFRDVLAGAGRWGVSVDPGAVDWEDVCLEQDDDGMCVRGETNFLAYEIIGVTGTPFPAFSDAYIELVGAVEDETESEDETAPAGDESEAIAASATTNVGAHTHTVNVVTNGAFSVNEIVSTIRAHRDGGESLVAAAQLVPPRSWFEDPLLTEATPLTIEDDGYVFGHVATFTQCHVGWAGTCITAPDKIAMSLFHTGTVKCDEGMVSTGPLIMGTDHPATDRTIDARAALDYYAHTGFAWADVRLGTDKVGIWCAGAMRPGITDEQVRVLRASSLSGDWRTINGELQLCAVLAVNTPGFPIPRALAASGVPYPHEASLLRARFEQGHVLAATGLGVVRPCKECGKERASLEALFDLVREVRAEVAEMKRMNVAIEHRTRALTQTRREQLAARLRP